MNKDSNSFATQTAYKESAAVGGPERKKSKPFDS